MQLSWAGASSLEVDQGSLVSQPGSGMSATVGGQRVAVGNADWVASCMPQAASPPQLSSHAPQGGQSGKAWSCLSCQEAECVMVVTGSRSVFSGGLSLPCAMHDNAAGLTRF